MGSIRHDQPMRLGAPAPLAPPNPEVAAAALGNPRLVPRRSAQRSRKLQPRHFVVPAITALIVVTALGMLLPTGGASPAHVAAAQSSQPSDAGGAGPMSTAPGFVNVVPSIGVTPPVLPVDPSKLTDYRWPLPAARVTLPFGPTDWGTYRVDGKLFHDGVDMATFCGDRVVAAHDGTVLAAGRHFDDYIGWAGDLEPYYARLNRLHAWNDLPITIVTDDGNGYRSIYAHFAQVTVKPGQTVKAGDLIGYEGDTGHATGCHLHYGLFSPLELAQVALDPKIAKRMELPGWEIARVNPFLVLPWRWDVEEMRGLRTPPPGATPPPTPSPSPSASSKPSAKP